MREESLRTILLEKAVEDVDPGGRWIALADRETATREAQRAVERAAGAAALQSASGREAALLERARRLLDPLIRNQPALAPLVAPLSVPWWAGAAAIGLAVASGVVLSALDGARRIDILALPILGIVGWNLLVYLWLAVAWYRRRFRRNTTHRRAAGGSWFGRFLGTRLAWFTAETGGLAAPLDEAARRFAAGLGAAFAPLVARHLRRTLHVAAAGLALGLLAGLYLRGVVLRFEAGWESTFLGPGQVLALLKILYGPVAAAAGLALPWTVEAVAALRWTATGGGDAAPWIHLIALCLVVYVIVPRLALAAVESLAARRLRRTVELPASLVAFGESLYGAGVLPDGRAPTSVVNLSLISHTNAGKTTLARTLLRRDVGEVRDAPHVTTAATEYELIATPEGDLLQLWDTPGFSGTERLAGRLQQSANPIGWLLAQLWDRFTDRDFFLSQRAVRNVRDHTDVVLYVVDASDDPVAVAYLDSEMSILRWIGKPVLVLLNQLGPAGNAEAEQARLRQWRERLAQSAGASDVLEFDAFARCWVQEHTLLGKIAALLPPATQPAFGRLAVRWRERNAAVFDHSMQVLAHQLAATATDAVAIGSRGLGERARALLGEEDRGNPAEERAAGELAARLDDEVCKATDELIRLHGLAGQAAAEVLARMGQELTITKAADVAGASMLGGALTGALGGLAADLAAGGLTFGAGAVIGAVIGAVGARTAAQAYNLARGVEKSSVRWSADFLTGRVVAAVMRYLAVAHFGRGRGAFAEDEFPWHWRTAVEAAVRARKAEFDAAWASAGAGAAREDIGRRLVPLVSGATDAVLRGLYPAALPADERRQADAT
ncbi:MAG: hypothetical protein AMXMBFR8_22260 [Nevskiales bacterium]